LKLVELDNGSVSQCETVESFPYPHKLKKTRLVKVLRVRIDKEAQMPAKFIKAMDNEWREVQNS
jgi:hypothetical protein